MRYSSRSGLMIFIQLCAATGFLMQSPPSLAQTYTVKIIPTLNGFDVAIEPVASTDMLVVNLTNKSTVKLRCDLRYDAAPQPLSRKVTFVDPGKTEPSVFKAKRTWHSVDVDVNCKAAKP